MSGKSEDDVIKELIIVRLNMLRESAKRNLDTVLMRKIDELIKEVYALETY